MRKSDDPLEQNPWTFVSREEIFDNWLINHSEHKLLNVKGDPITYTLVHFKNRAVGVVAYEDDHIWLVGQWRYPLEAYSWELPEGGCPPGQTTLDCAKWELEEETGLTAESYAPFLTLHTSNAITDEHATLYLATGLTQGRAKPEDNEVLKTRKISIDDLVAEVDAGKITDAMTVAAAYKLAVLRAQKKLP